MGSVEVVENAKIEFQKRRRKNRNAVREALNQLGLSICYTSVDKFCIREKYEKTHFLDFSQGREVIDQFWIYYENFGEPLVMLGINESQFDEAVRVAKHIAETTGFNCNIQKNY